MDGSMTGYYLAAGGLILTFSALFPGRWVYPTLSTLIAFLLIFSNIIVTVDLELYHHWGFRMNTTPLFYMGSGAMGSIDGRAAAKVVAIFIGLTSLAIWIYFRWIGSRVKSFPVPEKKAAIFLFLLSALMFLPIRGSFTVAPMNTGFVFFHPTKAYANHAAINVVWNFLYSVRGESGIRYPESFFPKPEAEKLFSALYPPTDSTKKLFRVDRPNVILIIVESYTADVIEPLGGLPGIAPRLNQLCKEGILFDQIYSGGDRTDKGMLCVLSGYPAQPLTSIIKYPAKAQKLPSLQHSLKLLGYKSSFIYGGDVDFANFRSYLTSTGFDHLTTMDDFPDDINESKWGIHDHFVLERSLQELDTTTAPFFKTILTLSSHEPFDVPMEPHIKGNDVESMFLNSCYYTDQSIGNFIDAAKTKSWWDNTVIILTADHGHRSPGNKELKDRRRFHIPLLILGGAIRSDTVIHTLGGQTDIANTLLSQLDRPQPEFKFSKNLLAHNVVPFAAYYFNDGYGFLLPGKFMVYDNPGKQFLENEQATVDDLNLSKAYQQVLYSDYNSR
jgi:phosphoglycerol transferase MdoB-like AlkP superfamily enzyme